MWETGKTSQIATEMRRFNSAVLEISESHRTQAGQQRLDTTAEQQVKNQDTDRIHRVKQLSQEEH
ncbi:unnamed protein product [Schistosoma margrebowiei]|uniref:Uncharacterized protein n=1 Tax=Schistosoma margrebowiei TaxID=48269 RepID=A0A183MCZ9_9TREM|nr:unnamed protein product [Schistosoma margrebowiei]